MGLIRTAGRRETFAQQQNPTGAQANPVPQHHDPMLAREHDQPVYIDNDGQQRGRRGTAQG